MSTRPSALIQTSISSCVVRMTGMALGMDRRDDRVRLGRKESEQVVRRLAFLDLAHRRPTGPDAGDEGERAAFIEGEPDRRPGTVRQDFILGETRERDDASALDAEPSSPVRRGDIADVCDARIGVAALVRAKTGEGMPQRAIVSSRTPSAALRTIGAE
jgi:hypothetical protein